MQSSTALDVKMSNSILCDRNIKNLVTTRSWQPWLLCCAVKDFKVQQRAGVSLQELARVAICGLRISRFAQSTKSRQHRLIFCTASTDV